jgi:hypothetical protein
VKIQTKIQIDPENYEFIKKFHKDLSYRTLSEYMREAVNAKVKEDRKRIREKRRIRAMQMIGESACDNLFESIEGDDFEDR